MKISLVPERIARRPRGDRRLGLLAAVGGAFGATGLIGLLSTGSVHHPVLDTAFVVFGATAVTLTLFIRYRRT